MFADFGVAQSREREVSLHVAPEERTQIVVQLMAHLGPLMDHVAEQVAGRYLLRQVPALRASAQAALQEGNIKGFFRDASGAPSLEPLLRAALANHLNAQQVDDYLVFARARKDREKQAVGAQMVAWADQHHPRVRAARKTRTAILAAGQVKDDGTEPVGQGCRQIYGCRCQTETGSQTTGPGAQRVSGPGLGLDDP